MNLEFLPDGSPDCPLIRRFAFDAGQARLLERAAADLARGDISSIKLHRLPLIEAVDATGLTLRRHEADLGIEKSSERHFVCRLTPETWGGIAEPITAFEIPTAFDRTIYHWLDESGPVSRLFSPTGGW